MSSLIAQIEVLLLSSPEPLTIKQLGLLLSDDKPLDKKIILQALLDIQHSCQHSGHELVEVASGWRFQIKSKYSQLVNRLWQQKPQKYSKAFMEILAIIAYKQPITRAEIESVRGITVSSQILKSLLEQQWIKVVGQKEVIGRPNIYATTRFFLDYFNLKAINDLPPLPEIKDMATLDSVYDA